MIENELLASIILAIVQGITEWLPISSSGHLVIFENFIVYKEGLIFEVALHFGTLMAVFVYFGKDIVDILQDFLTGKWNTENGKTGILLIVASIPAAVVGFFVAEFFDNVLSDLKIVALGFAITGMFLLIASFQKNKKEKKLTYKNSFLIGIAQALALIPGISRAGATISSGVLLGLSEKNAIKFSFLMSIPIILGANIYSLKAQTLPSELIWASLVSFLVGLLTIHLLFKYILVKRQNFRWFAVYCLLLALGLGIWLVIF